MSNFTDMPLETALRAGDIVTITGPGEHDVTVREVMGVHEHTGPFVSDMASTTIRFAHLISGLTRTLTRVQRPVPVLPALPTVPGVYEVTKYPARDGGEIYLLINTGRWYGSGDGPPITKKAMQKLGPLTRLIPETEISPAELTGQKKHPEVDIQKAWNHFTKKTWGHETSEETDKLFVDFENTIGWLIAGEFNK